MIYSFSVIVPIYNCEYYLEEAILSIVNQSLPFLDNIELLLVNDGSTDKSADVCKKYQQLYPQNIKFLEQTNQGKSVARNKGFENAKGKYITFFDADDKWDINSFKIVLDFFNSNDDVDVVSCRVKFFEKRIDYPGLDWRFKTFDNTKIVDISKESNYIQMNGNSCFIKRDIINNKFDERLCYAEDLKFITELILKNKRYALLKNAIYLYRVRNNNDSAMQIACMDIRYFTDTIDYSLIYLKDLFKKKHQDCLDYINNIILYDFHWRLNSDISKILTLEAQKFYYNKLYYLLENINIEEVNKKRFLKPYQKELICKYKLLK